MATTLKTLAQGSPTTLLSTELNSLANNTGAVSSVGGTSGVFDPSPGVSGFDGYPSARLELNIGAPGGTLAAGSSINVWFLRNVDGTNYEDGSSSVTPARNPDCVFPLRAVSTAQRIVRRVKMPVGTFKVLLLNNGTGQALNASGNTLKVLPDTEQGV